MNKQQAEYLGQLNVQIAELKAEVERLEFENKCLQDQLENNQKTWKEVKDKPDEWFE